MEEREDSGVREKKREGGEDKLGHGGMCYQAILSSSTLLVSLCNVCRK